MKLVRVVAPKFVAGFVVRDGVVDTAAPILRRDLLGRSEDAAREVIRCKGWKASVVEERDDDRQA